MRRVAAVLALALAAGLVFGAVTAFAAEEKNVILATTTSTKDTGLLEVLIPEFQKQTGYFVKDIAVGSGQAMAMGEKGEVDVLLVHSPAAEEKFMADGFGKERLLVMHNDFIIVGPAADPAGVKGAATAKDAFKKIADAGALWISRADKSGTHTKEMGLWKAAGVTPEGQKWYTQTGLGMGQTLSVASEKAGYTLADRGTYMSLKKNLALEILAQGDAGFLNVYHVITVNADKFPKVNAAGGKALADFMVAPATQKVIGTYGVEKYGSPLFFPDAGKAESDVGKK